MENVAPRSYFVNVEDRTLSRNRVNLTDAHDTGIDVKASQDSITTQKKSPVCLIPEASTSVQQSVDIASEPIDTQSVIPVTVPKENSVTRPKIQPEQPVRRSNRHSSPPAKFKDFVKRYLF